MAALLLILIVFGLFYTFMVRSQRRRVATQQRFLDDLQPGDRVVTAGGVIGDLVAVEGGRARLEIAPGVVIEVLAPAITRRAPAPPGETIDDETAAPRREDG